ncbi:MAG: STAS/SEC14 domain-containing protein [Anaerolineae bacterium]|nr:STAS/SEC14 domain-containing protein [Anaerolineae bacterium]
MIEKMSESAGNVVGYRVVGKVTKEDYTETLFPEVGALVAQEGSIGLLLQLDELTGEEAKAWGTDIKFGKEYHKKIERLAVVGNGRLEKIIASLADPFYAQDAKYFHTDDIDTAWEWVAGN